MKPHPVAQAIDLLEAGLGNDHDGYQLRASLHGETLVDHAGGEARPGRPMEPTTITAWFSAGKPVTAVAVLQLWERGLLGLDDPIASFISGFANGKERVTVRHVLTHTGGFPFADDSLHPEPWDVAVRRIADAPAQWEPGTAAGYHGTSGHIVLGEVVRVVDGRPIERYAADEIFAPLGMDSSFVALPSDRLAALRERLALVEDRLPREGPGHISGLTFGQFNEEPTLTAVSPGNTCRGPARELEMLMAALVAGGVGPGGRILQPTTVEAMVACHRRGLVDRTFAANDRTPHRRWGQAVPWGLGVELDGNFDIGTRNSPRVFASSGAFSSIAFGDPQRGLSCVVVTTGLIELDRNAARLSAVADAVNEAVDG